MNLLWLLLIPFADRFVGMGIVSRFISLPLASTIIGTSLMLAMWLHWEWILIFGGLFALGRGPATGEGFKLITGEPLDPNRITWNTKWMNWVADLATNNYIRAGIWAFLRIFVYYLPFWLAISLQWGMVAAFGFALCWVASYGFVKPIYNKFKLPVIENIYTSIAEMTECVLFAVIIELLV